MLLTSDHALSEKSKPHVEGHASAEDIPRHYMIVSIPCEHPEAPPRDGLVRGQYESIEMIREIPVTPAKSTTEGSIERKEDASPDDPETNPVEWIMITRSDPGGGIPRFLIDRGTPGSIVADTSKFLNWACAMDEIPGPDEDEDKQASLEAEKQVLENPEAVEAPPRASFSAASRNAQLAGVGDSIADRPLTDPSSLKLDPTNNGMFSSFTNALGNGIQSYAPQSVASYLQPTSRETSPSATSDTVSETSSIHSFASAEQWATAEDGGAGTANLPAAGASSESLNSTLSKAQSTNDNRFDKELSKLDSKRTALDEKMQKMREKEQARTQQATEREEREKRKAVERYEREMAKLEAKREKEAQKMEQRRKKEEDKNVVTKLQRERDEFKSRAEMAERENRLLKEQVGELQGQNTKMAQRLGKTEQGQQVLRAVSDEIKRDRSGSTASSSKSKASK